jgi:hypothetical protein
MSAGYSEAFAERGVVEPYRRAFAQQVDGRPHVGALAAGVWRRTDRSSVSLLPYRHLVPWEGYDHATR